MFVKNAPETDRFVVVVLLFVIVVVFVVVVVVFPLCHMHSEVRVPSLSQSPGIFEHVLAVGPSPLTKVGVKPVIQSLTTVPPHSLSRSPGIFEHVLEVGPLLQGQLGVKPVSQSFELFQKNDCNNVRDILYNTDIIYK